MSKTQRKPYPYLLVDPALDFEATKNHYDKGSCIYRIGEFN